MTGRIVIYQLTGAEPTPVEEFAVDAFTVITLGREPGSTVRFDTAGDAGVSPRHCRIRLSGEPLRLLLSDCGGGSGTLVNGRRIETEVEVMPGEEIELGSGGPKFVFDWAAETDSPAPRKVRLSTAEAAIKNALVPVRPVLRSTEPAGRALIVRPKSPWWRQVGLAYGLLCVLMLGVAVVGTASWMGAPATPAQRATQASEPVPAGSATSAQAAAAGDKSAAETPAVRSGDAAPTAAALSLAPPQNVAIPERQPDLAGTVRKIAGASRFQVRDQWIELYGVDDPTTKGEHNQAVYQYLKPFSGAVECYGKAYGRFECFGGGQNLAVLAIRRGFVRLTSDAPSEYYALVRRMAAER
jgi:hypothetical protein